jgi:hypothetical protein
MAWELAEAVRSSAFPAFLHSSFINPILLLSPFPTVATIGRTPPGLAAHLITPDHAAPFFAIAHTALALLDQPDYLRPQ